MPVEKNAQNLWKPRTAPHTLESTGNKGISARVKKKKRNVGQARCRASSPHAAPAVLNTFSSQNLHKCVAPEVWSVHFSWPRWLSRPKSPMFPCAIFTGAPTTGHTSPVRVAPPALTARVGRTGARVVRPAALQKGRCIPIPSRHPGPRARRLRFAWPSPSSFDEHPHPERCRGGADPRHGVWVAEGNNQHNPQYANYWAPLTRTRHTPRHIQHSPGTPTPGLRECGNDTSKSTGRSGRQKKAAPRRNMRRDERVTVQGPVKKQQPDGMSHRGRQFRCLHTKRPSHSFDRDEPGGSQCRRAGDTCWRP